MAGALARASGGCDRGLDRGRGGRSAADRDPPFATESLLDAVVRCFLGDHHLRALATADTALVVSPESRIPPSAITGTLCRDAARAQSAIAVIIGTPMPATTRVVQIEPAPMPTLTASTPRSISASVASAVATLPAT